jgi:hypothetical protein
MMQDWDGYRQPPDAEEEGNVIRRFVLSTAERILDDVRVLSVGDLDLDHGPIARISSPVAAKEAGVTTDGQVGHRWTVVQLAGLPQ